MLKYFLMDSYDFTLVEVSREVWMEEGSEAWSEICGSSFAHCGQQFDVMGGANLVGAKVEGNWAILLRDGKGRCLAEWRYRDSDAMLDSYRALRYSKGQQRLVDHFYLLEHP